MTTSRQVISYEEFGRAFVEAGVTAARVEAAVREMAGERLELGPIEAGPGGVAQAWATGDVGAITAERDDDGDRLGFRVVIAIPLDLEVLLAEVRHRFHADIEVPLRLVVATALPLALVVEAIPPRSREVRVKVHAKGLQAKVIGKVGNIDAQICQQAAQFVRDRLEHPDARAAMTIELAELIEQAWPE